MKHMSPEERAEYSDAMDSVLIDRYGDAIPTRDYPEAVAALVDDAEQAHRTWAAMVRDEALRIGYASIAKKWLKQQQPVRTPDGTLGIVDRPAYVGIKRATADAGPEWQQALIVNLSREEVDSILHATRGQIRALRVTELMHEHLLALFNLAPDAATVGAALQAVGMTLDQYLTGGRAA